MEDNRNTRFTKKYPNGWVVQGNNDKRWLKLCRPTNVIGHLPENYYTSYFGSKLSFRISRHDELYNMSIISIDEFFALYENKEPIYSTYEIY